MDLDPMIVSSHDGDDEHSYSDYDNRPIRPMNQEALNETLARLPILIDDEDYVNRTTGSSESNTSVKARLTNRRQPNLAYSTRRKNLPLATSDINRNNQSLLHVNTTIATPKNNKRKLGGCTPAVTPSATKVIKQLDCRLELIQLKDENKVLQEAKNNLEYECALLKSSHQTELEQLKEQHQQTIDALNQEHQNHSDQWKSSLAEKEQLLVEANLELENLRNERTLLLLEKETLEKIVNDYQNMKEEMTSKLNENESVIKNLREEVETLTKLQQQLREQKQLATKTSSASTRAQTKVANADRPRTTASTIPVNGKPESTKSKTSTKAPVPRSMKREERLATPVSINASLNKSNSSLCSSISTLKVAPSKSKMKPSVVIEEKKKSMSSLPSTEKRTSLIATRTRSKAIPAK